MRAKTEKQLLAEKLRSEQGLSYQEIARLTGISKSTLSAWLRNIPLSPDQEHRLQERLETNRASFAARALPINRERHQRAREQSYQAGAEVVNSLPHETAIDELALAMLYLGEGAKKYNRVQMASTDPAILRFFVWALLHLYNVEKGRLSYRLHLAEAARPFESGFRSWWTEQLGCPDGRFEKTQFDRRSTATGITSDYHGVCTVTLNDTYLQQRILGLASAYLQSRSS